MHPLIILCFVLASENVLELFLDKGDTFGAPLVYLILLGIPCPTCGKGSIPQFGLGTDKRSESIEQRFQ
jgi:hypothetical protein